MIEHDARVGAWNEIAGHRVFADCYNKQGTLLSSMMARLDELAGNASPPEGEDVNETNEKPGLTDQLLRALGEWEGASQKAYKLKKQLKKQKRIHKHLWAAVKDLGDELDRKVQELEDLNFVADRRARQISCLRKDVVELQKKNDELVSVMTEMKPADETELRVDWEANYYNELKQNQLLAEKVAQLESVMTEMKPADEPQTDWQGISNIERNRREVAEAMVRSLRSKVERLEQALKGSRQNPTLPADVVIFYPNGTELTFLDRARNLFARS